MHDDDRQAQREAGCPHVLGVEMVVGAQAVSHVHHPATRSQRLVSRSEQRHRIPAARDREQDRSRRATGSAVGAPSRIVERVCITDRV